MMDDHSCDDIKSEIFDSKSQITYKRGDFLGKGGFARCYEFKNITTGEVFAGKVILKSTLLESYKKEKIDQEISIHSAMSHQFIVSLHSYFEDESNLYIILELCRKRSLQEMHKRRKTLTVPEVRYFMRQIVLACIFLHENKVIHRDLKLNNLFLNDNMEIKVGDFGLATRLSHDEEKKTCFCGTLNYMAPEILLKKGYSLEVDIWSLGCIIYTLLVGTLPFKAASFVTTFQNIKSNEYHLPQTLESSAKDLIQKLLHPNPECRPLATDILKEAFFENQDIPVSIPDSCLVMPPRCTENMTLMEESKIYEGKCQYNVTTTSIEYSTKKMNVTVKAAYMPLNLLLKDLLTMVDCVINRQPEAIYSGNPEDAQDPSAVPFVWITKWVDYTDKYGIGYQLCDNTIGVIFNDNTHMILLAGGKNLQYITENNEQQYYTTKNCPKDLSKKFTTLIFFNTYMYENLSTAGANTKPREGDERAQAPYLFAWLRKDSVIVFYLTNGTFQVNFFEDHTKIILCPVMGAVSYIDEEKNFTVYTFKLIEKYGCPLYLASKLRYAKQLLQDLNQNFEEFESKQKSNTQKVSANDYDSVMPLIKIS